MAVSYGRNLCWKKTHHLGTRWDLSLYIECYGQLSETTGVCSFIDLLVAFSIALSLHFYSSY